MNTKLTLTIERDIIEQAKVYAKQRGRSLSNIIENYLKLIIGSEQKNNDLELPPIVKELSGIYSVPPNFDAEKIKREHLQKKYSK